MKVRFAGPANVDLEEIGDWIAQEDPLRAATFIADLRRASAALSRHPRRYPIASPVAAAGIRKKVYRRYLIFYRVQEQEVQILRIIHGSRDWAALLRVGGKAALG